MGTRKNKQTNDFLNNHYDSATTAYYDAVGGNKQEWKLEIGKLSKSSIKYQLPSGMDMEEYLDLILQENNRLDCPILLDSESASFVNVGIHGLLRQRLEPSTVKKHLRYARFMELHLCPVDFKKPSFKNFVAHMDYREQIEKATPCALEHEWRAMQMFLRAYGMKISDWPYKPPSRPKSYKRVLPYPETVHKFFTYKYSNNKYETALYQYMFFFGFFSGVRAPSEIINMKVSDVHFEEKNRGYIVITETKKHNTQRTIIPERSILNSKVHKSLKNWITTWRPKKANKQSGDALFLQPSGKPFTIRHLGHKLSKHGKKVWNDFSPYDMRHWCAVARLIKTKCETGRFDCYPIKNWLGHERMATTEGYVEHAEKYYRDFPVDWLSCALKSPLNVTGMHKNEKNRGKNQQNAIFGSVGILPFCSTERAGRDLNPRMRICSPPHSHFVTRP